MYTGFTFNGPVVNYLNPSQIAQDATGGWVIKDTATAGTTYYGFTQTTTDQSQPVWKIRREVLAANVTLVTYASGGQFNNIWTNRASLTYA